MRLTIACWSIRFQISKLGLVYILELRKHFSRSLNKTILNIVRLENSLASQKDMQYY